MDSNPFVDDEDSTLLRYLKASPEIFAAIAASSASELSSQRKLREAFDEALVRAALSVHDARQRAVKLLPNANKLWLTRVGLEQSTSWQVATHKAERFLACDHVFDLCSGIGVDAAAIAEKTTVTAIDSAPAMCLRTQWNAEIWHRADRLQTQCADVTNIDWTGKIVHVDPDRRSGRDRPTKRLEFYQPNLEWMQQLSRTTTGGGIKVSPASNFLQKFPGCEIELISLHGECREATVWFGSLAGEHTFRATVLPSGETISAEPLSAWTNVVPAVAEFIFDPDPAIVRSGLLDVMAEQQGLCRLDAEEEYLTGSAVLASGFVTAFQVEAVLPGHVKDLKRYLLASPSSQYEIKCRRIPTDADQVRRQLPTGDGPPRVIIFARIAGRSNAIVARRV
ncbi:MAG TPA: class I SAM-dependent methyltransferase [Planctomycetaceae bacterium]|nr:class I SAM-dependent methyltransferase [Planctomycetaceae bacterium]HQZ65463.1 class I SAM-dependent methyltransferase [Planctomycetaceae bacterium]HRA86432.1 class I SAM-dependent methyltransferase [Planctomycetaceae bacterium]